LHNLIEKCPGKMVGKDKFDKISQIIDSLYEYLILANWHNVKGQISIYSSKVLSLIEIMNVDEK
jgi:hypothetical protein